MKVYFAHCKADYGTQNEAKAIDLLREKYDEVVNPGSDDISRDFDAKKAEYADDPMLYFRKLVWSCQAVAWMPVIHHHFMYAPAGVATEVLEGFLWEKPVLLVCPWGANPDVTRQFQMPHHVLSVEQTRSYIRQVRGEDQS